MIRKFISIIALALPFLGIAQDTASLTNCMKWAIDASPLKQSYQKYDETSVLEKKNISNNWLPDLSINGKYSYLSEVTEIALDGNLPFSIDFPEVSHHQYGLTLDLKQTIWDGGMFKAQKSVKDAENIANKKQLDVDLYSLKSQISAMYFSMLLFQKQMNRIDLFREILEKQRAKIDVAVKNGVMLETSLNIIDAELINLQQQYNDLSLSFESVKTSLEKQTSKTIDSLSSGSIPEITSSETGTYTREEIQLFETQQNRLELSKKILTASRMPKVYAFGTFGYGYPGLSMFTEGAHDYFVVGAGFSWTICDWKDSKRQRQIVDIQKSLIEDKKNNFTNLLDIKQQSYLTDIKKVETQLENDKLLIDLRKKISKNMQVQLDNGIITISDFVNELNKEKEAVLLQEIHQIQLEKAKADYLIFLGKL